MVPASLWYTETMILTGWLSQAIQWAGIGLNFLPLVWLTVMAYHHGHRDAAYWWLAVAFGIGGVFDVMAKAGLGANVASHVYPITQTAIIVAVLLDRYTALFVLTVLLFAATLSLLAWPEQPDLILHSLAWGGIGYVANRMRPIGTLWLSLFCAFGLALPCWWWFIASGQSLAALLAMQGCYAVGVGLFCWSTLRPEPKLRVA